MINIRTKQHLWDKIDTLNTSNMTLTYKWPFAIFGNKQSWALPSLAGALNFLYVNIGRNDSVLWRLLWESFIFAVMTYQCYIMSSMTSVSTISSSLGFFYTWHHKCQKIEGKWLAHWSNILSSWFLTLTEKHRKYA